MKVIQIADNYCGLQLIGNIPKHFIGTHSFKPHNISVSWMVLFLPFLQVGRMKHREGEQHIQVTQEVMKPGFGLRWTDSGTQTFDPYTALC